MVALTLPLSAALLASVGVPARDLHDLPDSPARFADGGHFRIEIPSVEGPAAFDAVLGEAARRSVAVHRVSQGSGVWLLTDDELDMMADRSASTHTQVVLFCGPRASWDTGVQARSSSGAVIAGALRGDDQLAFAVEDALRAAAHCIDGVLVADLGLLRVLGSAKRAGELPADFELKVSVNLPVGNAATARVLEDLGATSLNLPVDLPLAAIAAIRAAVDVPVDMYVESADEFGATLRHYEIGDLIRVAAPVYVKFTVSNAPGIYPSGAHLEPTVIALARERVRRAQLGLDLLERLYPGAVASPLSVRWQRATLLQAVRAAWADDELMAPEQHPARPSDHRLQHGRNATRHSQLFRIHGVCQW